MPKLDVNPPTVTLEVYLVPHGFQANLFLPGQNPLVIISDFADEYPVINLTSALADRLKKALSGFYNNPVPSFRNPAPSKKKRVRHA